MKLYYSPGACSLAPHIILREIGSPFELVKVELKSHQTQNEKNFYTINPKGYVPLLELDSGEYLSEGPVIAQYLCDKAERRDLMPMAGTIERYRVLEWQNFITAELHKSFGALFNPAFDTNAKAINSNLLRKRLGWVSEQLKGKQYLTGPTFTAADAYLFVVAGWTKAVNIELSELDNLHEFYRRVAELPSVKAALKAEE